MINKFYLQDDEKLNEKPAWVTELFPQSRLHYFKDGGCVITSLFNMLVSWGIDSFSSPWELHEVCMKKDMYYETSNIELTCIDRVAPVHFAGREPFNVNRLIELLETDEMRCLIKVNGINSRYHYVLALPGYNDIVFWDPKKGITHIDMYGECFEIIFFSRCEDR